MKMYCEAISVDIYIDVIIMENIIMNYIILWVTGKFLKAGSSGIRLFLAALTGAGYMVLMIMLPGVKVYYTFLGKFLLSLLIVAIAFSPAKINSFLKSLAAFYITTFIFAGAAFAFIYINNTGGIVKNGVIYIFWESKWTTLLLSIITSIIILRVFWELVQSRISKEKLLRNVEVYFEKKVIAVSALVDTGNSLRDPLTNLPVMVIEFSVLEEILPDEIKEIFIGKRDEDLALVSSIVTKSNWLSRFRLIPFTSLGKENGMLIGFKPDCIKIGDDIDKRDIKNVIVGIYNKALSRNEHYRALLSPELYAVKI